MASTDCSPRPLEPILMVVNGCNMEVWLRRNIRQDTDEDGNEVWMADAVHGELPASTTGAYVSANFDALWDEWDDTPLTRRIADVRGVTETHDDAIAELSEVVSDADTSITDVMDAIADLSGLVSDLYETMGGE